MDRNAFWKWLILIVATVWSIVLIYPPLDQKDAAGHITRPGKLKFGLDLQGGASFTLQVDTSELTDDAKKDAQARALEVLRNRVDAMGISEPIIYPEPDGERIVVQIPGLKAEDRAAAIKLIQSAAFLEFRMVHPENDKLVDELFASGQAPLGYRVVGVDEQAPNGSWIKNYYYKRDKSLDPEGATEDTIRARLRSFNAPPGHELLLEKSEKQNQELFKPYYVSRRRELTGEGLKTAGVDYRQFGQPVVNLKFDSKASRKFANVTSDYAPGGAKNPSPDGRRYMAIVLDGTLYSAPFIRTAIFGGEAIIEGSFTLKEAQDLAIVLRAGSLPAPVEVIEQRGVDPTLGHDSISSGKRAAVYGGIAVLAFMMIYYLLAGVVANLALLLDALLLPLGMMIAAGFLSLLTGGGGPGGAQVGLPTLTLPGIAGLVLTIGMAVDANVLIFERIREEQRAGKKLASAIDAGYEKVFSTIFDANITTLLTAIILFWKGSGPIRGFAVTLSAGILVSMIMALVVTRLFFNTIAAKTNLTKIRMLNFLRDTKIDFVGKRVIAATLSISIIIGSWVLFIQRGQDNFGVDFTGGAAITFQFDQKEAVDSIRSTLSDVGIAESFIQYQKEMAPDADGHTKEYLEIKVGFDEGDKARDAMLTKYADAGFRVVKEDSVGPQVGKELKKQGVTAIVAALIGIVLYITIRFEFAFAIGAIVALAHDVLVTVGLFTLFGRQLSLPIVAALLTIVGYSVNDTIVVFDRIREDLKLMKGRSYKDIANLSINQTLSRTLLTSITTLLSVVMLLIFGGGAINDFALALFIGIVVGTYSSIFVATPIVLLWHREKKEAAK
ncbi:MAG: protein translocase subunit SecD [Verrucomicrobia bacterium]|nr:protein translocase subunit SecD [Verrucomicrobiota bacterium]